MRIDHHASGPCGPGYVAIVWVGEPDGECWSSWMGMAASVRARPDGWFRCEVSRGSDGAGTPTILFEADELGVFPRSARDARIWCEMAMRSEAAEGRRPPRVAAITGARRLPGSAPRDRAEPRPAPFAPG